MAYYRVKFVLCLYLQNLLQYKQTVQFNYNIKLQKPTQTKRKVEIQVTHPISTPLVKPLRKTGVYYLVVNWVSTDEHLDSRGIKYTVTESHRHCHRRRRRFRRRHVATMQLGHLLASSGPTHPKFPSVAFPSSFCLLMCSFLLS